MKIIAIVLIKAYQWTFGPFTSGNCKFVPSCSEYSILAFKKYGVIKGFILTVKRILKCNPWSIGGNDPLG